MTVTTNLALPLIAAAQAQKHVTHNEALLAIDALLGCAVKDKDLTAPPGAPAEGDRYIIAAAPTGAWAGKAANVAAWQDGVWRFYPPKAGLIAFVVDELQLYHYNGASWAAGVLAITNLQNLALLGVGTTADATNPFSTKLNAALHTAKTVAEGGTGTVQMKLSKESAAKTASILFQDNFSGRAEIGLTGDDNLHIKVSADGASWTEAIQINRTSGAVSLPATPVAVKPWSVTKLTASNPAWPLPAGTTEMEVQGWGGGGSGAGGDTTTNQRGSGGGAGGYFRKNYAGTMDATLNVTVGTGGAGVASVAGGANGNAGSATSVVGASLGTLTANGGQGGLKGIQAGGAGGGASSGDESIAGQDGMVANIGGTPSTSVAAGGSSPRGGPGGQANVGASGQAPGGGGACGNHTAGGMSGAGANGYVIIRTR